MDTGARRDIEAMLVHEKGHRYTMKNTFNLVPDFVYNKLVSVFS